jgi:acyl-CoA thioester hydrolase
LHFRFKFWVKELQASYHSSAKLGDLLHVKSSLIEVKNASFKLHQAVFREDEKIFEMDITLVFIDFNGKVKKFEVKNLDLLHSLFI